jgi:hypothetical protein
MGWVSLALRNPYSQIRPYRFHKVRVTLITHSEESDSD